MEDRVIIVFYCSHFSPRKRVKDRKKRVKSPSRKSISRRRDEETEDSEESGEDRPPSLQPQPDPLSEPLNKPPLQPPGLKTNSQVDEDETEDSEDGDNEQPEPSRLRFMPILTSHANTKPDSSDEPNKTPEEPPVLQSEVDTNRQWDDEETEDSEDEDDQTEAVSVKASAVRADRRREDKITTKGDSSRHTPILTSLLTSGDTKQNKTSERVQTMEEQLSSLNTNNQSEVGESENEKGSRETIKPRDLAPVQYLNIQTLLPPQTPANASQLESCKVCNSWHGSLKKLMKHSWIHVNDRAMLCGMCGDRLETTEELRRHLHSHQKTLTCDICGKSFISKSGFKRHMNQHKGNKPYKCETCNKDFTDKGTLQRHILTHQNSQEYKCTTCPRSFNSDIRLKLHLLTHADRKQEETSAALGPGHTPAKERRLSCEICKRSFFTEKCFQVHMMKHGKKTPDT